MGDKKTTLGSAVLVVEDNEHMLASIRRTIRGAGLSSVGCSGRTPIAQAMADHSPRVAVVDWWLDGANSEELISTLATAWPNVPVIVYSGDIRPEIRAQAYAAGCWSWCSKADGALLVHEVALGLAENQRRVSGDGFPTLDEIHERAVRGALQRSGGNVSRAAQNLGITRGRLERLIRGLNFAA